MNITRKLTEGTGAWLHFEYACNRSGLFSEKYLSVPIGLILQSLNSERVIAEFKHPVLSAMKSGPGRRPEVDFVVCDPYPKIVYAVESKWIGSTKPSIESIVWDLIRLALIEKETGAHCIFLLGGKRSSLESFFETQTFSGHLNDTPRKPILHTRKNHTHTFPLVPTIPSRTPLLKKIFKPYLEHPFPEAVCSVRSQPFPIECPANNFQIYAWRIFTKKNNTDFYPKNSKHYIK